jgi:hypothetical protein
VVERGQTYLADQVVQLVGGALDPRARLASAQAHGRGEGHGHLGNPLDGQGGQLGHGVGVPDGQAIGGTGGRLVITIGRWTRHRVWCRGGERRRGPARVVVDVGHADDQAADHVRRPPPAAPPPAPRAGQAPVGRAARGRLGCIAQPHAQSVAIQRFDRR